MVLLDAAVVLYCGFVVLFIWRWLIWWERCGRKIKNLNYVTIGMALITVILAYDSFYFIQVATSDLGRSSWDTMPAWLRPWILACPAVCLVTLVASGIQTFTHVERIHEGSADAKIALWHDRAVQIILLPPIYGIMAMSSLTRMYAYIGSEAHPYSSDNKESLHRSLSRSETCFWVGDLYEAWALYQFGWLVLDVLDQTIIAGEESPNIETKSAAHGLRRSYGAVKRLAWLGVFSFLVVCVAEAGWSLWLLTFETSMTAKGFDQSMSKFVVAGFLASGVAIYNVFVVEEEYKDTMKSFHPRLKFFTVKILVTFAFMQRGIFKIWAWVGTLMPHGMRKWVDKTPFLGDVMNMPAAQFEMFYAALIITECFLVCMMHYWAWHSEEDWYEAPAKDWEMGTDEELANDAKQETSNFALSQHPTTTYGSQSQPMVTG